MRRMQSNLFVISLTDFNHIANVLGQPNQTLKDDNQTLLVPTTVAELKKFNNKENSHNTIDLVQSDTAIHLRVKKTVPYPTCNHCRKVRTALICHFAARKK